MHAFKSNRITWLYYTALGGEEVMINDVQKMAVSILLDLAWKGDPDAREALDQLDRSPSLHPLLKEMIEDNRTSVPHKRQTADAV
jgi:hypothetical protein